MSSICIRLTILFAYMTKTRFFTPSASKLISPYQNWFANGVTIFSIQFTFQHPFINDLKTDETDPSFLSTAQKTTHHQTFTNVLKKKLINRTAFL